MASLQTQYMGLNLNNPIIASSSGITGSVRGVRNCADAGAGAVVLKSMFEELIISQSEHLEHEMIQSEHPEAYEYIRAQLGMQLGPRPYLKFIEDVKSQVSVPVIASVNCSTPKWWMSYAQKYRVIRRRRPRTEHFAFSAEHRRRFLRYRITVC